MIKADLPPEGDKSELFKIINELCLNSLFWVARDFDIMLECEALNIHPETATIHINSLIEQGYIYRIEKGIYSIFPKIKNQDKINFKEIFQEDDAY